MSTTVLSASPFHYLDLSLNQDGGLGCLFSSVGGGKTQLLTHLGLYTILRSHVVLHISLSQSVQKNREIYEQSFAELLQIAEKEEHARDREKIERNRLLHSHLNAHFGLETLEEKLQLFQQLLDFHPSFILIDDYQISKKHLPEWQAFAQKHKLHIIFTQNELIEEAIFDLIIEVLHKESSEIQLIVRKENGKLCDQSFSFQKNLAFKPEKMVTFSPSDCVLYSGGAMGAEKFFGETAGRFGCREINFTFEGHDQRRKVGSTLLSDKELSLGSTSLNYVSRKLRRNWDHTPSIQKILQVLWHVVSHAEQVFVVGVIQPDNTVHGGTGWSVELAKRWHKPVWVYDQDREAWFHWSGSQWEQNIPTIRSKAFAGSGTRFLSELAKQAIRDLFARSFNS